MADNIELIYSEDDDGYYWQDFNTAKQSTSQVFNTKDEAIRAKENHTILWDNVEHYKMCLESALNKADNEPIIVPDNGRI